MNANAAKVKSIFLNAVEHCGPDGWPDFLDRECDGNAELRIQVERLLSGHRKDVDLIEQAESALNYALPTLGRLTLQEKPGSVIGPYTLLEQIGEGGMGVVFMAEQERPVRRRVALKVIKPGMDTREVIGRFEAERQALAMMEHPNIAKVHDAGATENGRPYFVMELVQGIPITEYCDQCNLTTRERLELFITVCQAVQHAHQKGVIHRDIKPNNVLVAMQDGLPAPKIIDFGVAKAIYERLTEQTLVTAFAQMIGTPLYMSPEQAELSPLGADTRSDIYSLGVLLYELLTGTTPFDKDRIHAASYDEVRRILREEEPPRPSARLSTLASDLATTIAEDRRTDLRRHRQTVRGELDWIVMKCLEKDRNRRYETASDLAADVQRYLNDEPVLAGPPSTAYRLRKFARRNRLVFASSAIIGFSLVAWAVGGIVYGIEQRRQSTAMTAIAQEAEQSRLQSEEDRHRAIKQRNEARQNQYYAEMVAGETEIANQNHGGLYARLVNHLPVSGEEDQREWEWYYLMSLCRPEDRALSCPGRYKYAAWSPDGQYIGTGGAIWRADTGERVRRFNTSYVAPYRVAWSPDGQKFAWAMLPDENAFYIWDRATDSISRFAAHDKGVWSLAWSHDGSQIASGSTDHTMKIWDVASKTLQWSVPTRSSVTSLDWSPDGKLLASCIDKRAVQLWDVVQHKPVHELPASTGREMEVAWRPDGSTLAVCEAERWYLLNRETLSITKERKISKGSAIDWSPDGSRMAVAHGEAVTIWDGTGEKELATLNGHLWPLLSVSWSPDGHRLVTSDDAGEIKIWDLDRPIQPPVITTGSPIRSLRWLEDNKTLITVAEEDGSSAWWDARHGSLKRRENRVLNTPIELSKDGRFAASYRKDQNAILILDASSGATRSVLRLAPERKVSSYVLSDDGSRIAIQSIAGKDSFNDFWKIDEEQLTATWGGRFRYPRWGERRLFTWDHAGMHLATLAEADKGDGESAGRQERLHILEATRGQRILKWNPSGDGSITAIAWSLDGRIVALGTSDGRVEAVELKNRRRCFSEKLDPRGICALAWHPSGRRLACATLDGAVKLVTSSDGKVLLRRSLPAGRATELAWSADGQRLAAATSDGQIQIWDSGRAHEISPDGSRRGELASAYLDRAGRSSGPTAEGAFREFLRYAPDTLDFWVARGSAYANLGDFERAAEEFSKGVEPDIQYAFESARSRAYALLAARKVERYRETCARLVDAFRNNLVPGNQGEVAWLCSLTRNEQVDSKQIVRMARFDYDDPDDGEKDKRTLRLAASLYRDGQYDEAVRILTELAAKLDRGGDSQDQWELASTRLFLALARLDMGQEFQARRLLDAANRTAAESQERSSYSFYRYWMDSVALNTLRREVEARLSGDSNDEQAVRGRPAAETQSSDTNPTTDN